MDKVDIRLEDSRGESASLRFHIQVNDESLLGHQAELRLELKAQVKDSRAVNDSRTLHSQPLSLSARQLQVEVPRAALRECYSYCGNKLDLCFVTRLVIDDGVLFDTRIEDEHELGLGDQPRIAKDDPKLMDPADAFNFLANLAALPHRSRVIVLALVLVGGLLVLGNMALGVHDQFVPESQVFFYDHRGSDGSESPFMKALAGSGATGVALWAAIMVQLRKYMRFELKSHPPLRRDSRIKLSDLVEGESRVPLRDVVLRVVACNRECGQYKRGSGTKERTVSFKEAVRAVKLYERKLPFVPAHAPITMYADDMIDFAPMFADLLPPLKIGANHGIEVGWEVQLLHPQYVDHELVGDSSTLQYRDFMDD